MDKKLNKQFELDVVRVRVELAILNKSQTWLAEKCGTTKQNFHILFRKKRINYADRIAEALQAAGRDVQVKDLLSPKI